jgi:cupin fold WbuC family metalloprotein
MIKITKELAGNISEKAKTLPRKRLNHNFHDRLEDPINRMINAVEPGAYFPPHKHIDPGKREVFIILSGRTLMLEFGDDGEVKDHLVLDHSSGNFGVEISPGRWHSLIPLERSVLYEIKDGPYSAETDKVFAKWAPREGEDEKAKDFVSGILEGLGIY